MGLLTAVAALVTLGVIVRLILDEIGRDRLACPYCGSHVMGGPLACPQCHRVLGRRLPHPQQ